MVTVERDGSLIFRVYLPHAQSVELMADFTDWGTGRVALAREDGEPASVDEAAQTCGEECGCAPPTDEDSDRLSGRGWWSVRMRAPEGDHAFSYLIDDHWWLPDYAAHGVKRNEHGHWTSLLFVPPKPRLLERLNERRVFSRSLRRSA